MAYQLYVFVCFNHKWPVNCIFLDVDECSVDNGGCFAHSSCVNTYGTFHCNCHTGYTMMPNGKQCTGTSLSISFHHWHICVAHVNLKYSRRNTI